MGKDDLILDKLSFVVDKNDFISWLNPDFNGQKLLPGKILDFLTLFLDQANSYSSLSTFFFKLSKNSNAPLEKWFDWFYGKFLIYYSLHSKDSLREISDKFNYKIEVLNLHIIKHFEDHKIDINKSKSLELLEFVNCKYSLLDLIDNQKGAYPCINNCVFGASSFIHYSEWESCLDTIRRKDSVNINLTTNKHSFRKFLFDFVLVVFAVLFALLVFKLGNKFYNNYLSKQIDIYERNFFWLDNKVVFKENKKIVRSIKLKKNDLEDLKSDDENFIFSERTTPESDVYLLGSDYLPKDVEFTALDKSKYEEANRGGFRDRTYGSQKAYRLILNSSDAEHEALEVKSILNNINFRKSGKVDLGESIPGGRYFNLIVLENDLDKLFSDFKEKYPELQVYISKINKPAPKNYSKVFIWIKNI